jgi:eukaryotic-like serine/threonine-protein kinase
MEFVKRLIFEAHRRSLWQVVVVYLAGSWVALQVVDALTRTAGLPDWVAPSALSLLVVGLPIVVATALVQEGAPGTAPAPEPRPSPGGDEQGEAAAGSDPGTGASTAPGPSPQTASSSFLERQLTWKRAFIGGVAAFALLGVAVTGYFVMRVAGIGPVASLVAQGAIEEGDLIILADFENTTPDPALSATVTGALRTDLASSPILSLVPDPRVRGALELMGRDAATPLDAELAREVAVREGLKAVLDGAVSPAGSGFILSATLRAAEDGRVLATFRRTARGPDDLIDAIDDLSRDIRERAGESLRAIRAAPRLSQVTTSSLPALQRYAEGERLFDRGDEMAAIALLEQAVALDPDFAMAWRKLAITLGNLNLQEERRHEAITRGYDLRDRLTEKERYLAEALYFGVVEEDIERQRRAYENALLLDPNDPAALNNLALIYNGEQRFDRAEELYRRALANRDASSGINYQNLATNLIYQGRVAEAIEVVTEFEGLFPDDARAALAGFWAHILGGDLREAERFALRLADDLDAPPSRRRTGLRNLTLAYTIMGRLAEADRRARELRTLVTNEFGAAALQADMTNRTGVLAGMMTNRPEAIRIMRELRDEGRRAGVPVGAMILPVHAIIHFHLDDAPGVAEVLELLVAGFGNEVPEEAQAEMDFFRSWLDGGRDDPGAMLEALERLEERTDCRRRNCFGDWRARFLEQAGRPDEALDEWKRLRRTVQTNWTYSLALLPQIHQETARLADQLGDREAALEAYEALIRLWADADPEFQPRVRAARERVAELSAEG